jgi:hypothetical protein
MKIVCVVWEDAADLDEGPWAMRAEMKPSTPTIFHQVGYLFELTPEAVVLTACVGEEQMGTRSRIPMGMVRSLTELTHGEPVAIPKRRRNRKAK